MARDRDKEKPMPQRAAENQPGTECRFNGAELYQKGKQNTRYRTPPGNWEAGCIPRFCSQLLLI